MRGFFSLLQVEGRGNGIKTRFVNIKTVSKSLERDPACKLYSFSPAWLTLSSGVTKFFGCEFGAVSNYNEGQGFGIVNGYAIFLAMILSIDLIFSPNHLVIINL